MLLTIRASRAVVALLIAFGLVGMHALVLPTMTNGAASLAAGHHANHLPGMVGDRVGAGLMPADNGCQTTHDHCLAVLRTPTPLAEPTDLAPAPALNATAAVVVVVLHAAQASDRAPPPTPNLVAICVSRT